MNKEYDLSKAKKSSSASRLNLALLVGGALIAVVIIWVLKFFHDWQC